jgi:hypothetical protein
MQAGAGVMPRSLPLRVGAGLAAASVATLLVFIIWLSDHDEPPPDRAAPNVVRVGLVEGQSLPGYLQASGSELSALTVAAPAAPVWALVSLDGYLPPGGLPAELPGAAVVQVYARLPQAGPMAQVVRIPVYRVPGDVVAGLRAAAAERDRERADYQRLGAKLTGGDARHARLRHAYDSAARTAAAEATAYRRGCACVFAAVVRGPPAALTGIAGHAGVRAVDPAPEIRRLDRTEFSPPLPEQQVTAPQDRRTATAPARRAASPVAPGTRPPLPSSTGANVTSPASDEPAPGPVSPAPASEESASAPAQTQDPGVPTATAGASGR